MIAKTQVLIQVVEIMITQVLNLKNNMKKKESLNTAKKKIKMMRKDSHK